LNGTNEENEYNAGRDLSCGNVGVFCGRHCLRARLCAPEIERLPTMLGTALLLAVCILLFGYLLVALLKPEEF
jgi:K+-transporting ATPase KdpF subunit